MKKLKFRAWHKGKQRMYEVVEIHLYEHFLAAKIIYRQGELEDLYEMALTVTLDQIVLMQFTGEYDTNGTEMYEGDIIEYLDNTSTVPVRKTVMIEDICRMPDFTCSKWEKIIGNIWEHLQRREGR